MKIANVNLFVYKISLNGYPAKKRKELLFIRPYEIITRSPAREVSSHLRARLSRAVKNTSIASLFFPPSKREFVVNVTVRKPSLNL